MNIEKLLLFYCHLALVGWRYRFGLCSAFWAYACSPSLMPICQHEDFGLLFAQGTIVWSLTCPGFLDSKPCVSYTKLSHLFMGEKQSLRPVDLISSLSHNSGLRSNVTFTMPAMVWICPLEFICWNLIASVRVLRGETFRKWLVREDFSI